MYIFAVHISHFRSIEEGWMFPNPAINVLLGPNNSGKTSFLRACTLVLDPMLNWHRDDLISRFDFFNGDTTNPIQIRVWLKPHEVETDDVKSKLFDKLSKWTVNMRDNHPVSLTSLILDPTDVINIPEHEELLAVAFTAYWDPDTQMALAELNIFDEVGNTISFLNEYKRLLDFRFFSTRRDPLQELSLARRSMLSRYLKDDELNKVLRSLRNALEGTKEQLVEQTQVRELLERLGGMAASEILNNLSSGLMGTFTITFLNSDIGRLRTATSLATQLNKGHNGETEESFPLLWNTRVMALKISCFF